MARKSKATKRGVHEFRPPFVASGFNLLDGLGYVCAQFSDTERIYGENPAEVMVDALNKKFGITFKDNGYGQIN